MKKIFRALALMAAALLLMTGCAAPAQPQAEPTATATPVDMTKSTGTGFYFDTVVTVTLYGAPAGIMDEIWAACARYEQLLSRTIPTSDVSRINAAGGEPVQVDPETWEILRRAKEISALTGGAFSVTVAPLSAMWDFTDGTNRMPTDEARLAALPLVNDEAIVLGENNTVTLPAGMQVDLGGIAKGHIADAVAQLLRGRVYGAILSLGGNVYVVGGKPDGSLNSIGIQDPADVIPGIGRLAGNPLGVVYTHDTSVVTSGTYERCFVLDGVKYHHILDPKTGLPAVSDLVSATLVMDSSMTADAMATACIVLGSEKALALCQAQGWDALLITADGQLLSTEGFMEKYAFRMLK